MAEELVTQVDDQQQDTQVDDSQQSEPFLKVNDRTVYKTQEDALKGFNEAQTKITSLSAFEKQIEHFVGKGQASPELVTALLTELVQRREAEKAAKATPKKESTNSEEDKEFEGKSADEIAQTKAGRKWLQENASKVGLISKNDYDALKKEFEDFKGGFSKRDEEERDAAINEGQSRIDGWLKEAKIDLNEQDRLKLEKLIAAGINHDDETLSKWLKGDRATRLSLIEEGYKTFLPVVKPGASPVKKIVEAGRQKQELIRRTPRSLPQDGDARQSQPSKDKQPPRIGDKSLRDKARALLDKMRSDE